MMGMIVLLLLMVVMMMMMMGMIVLLLMMIVVVVGYDDDCVGDDGGDANDCVVDDDGGSGGYYEYFGLPRSFVTSVVINLYYIFSSCLMPSLCKKREMLLACIERHDFDQRCHIQAMCSILHPSVPVVQPKHIR